MIEMTAADKDCVARTAWGEARSLGEEGMRAVICVIMNRVAKQKWYGLTPLEVCHKPEQFDCWLPNDPNLPQLLAVTTDDPQFAEACQLAEDAAQWNWLDITNGALNYYSTTIPLPDWAKKLVPCFMVGNTYFYNNVP